MYRIVLTGGGTAGHVIPNLALVPALKKYFDAIHYIGSNNSIEKKLAINYKLAFHSTEVVKLDRVNPIKNIKIPFSLMKGVKEARSLLQLIKPSVIFSKGGYVSLPTCFAAKQEKIPIVVHESDISLGVANRLVSKFADCLITSFEESNEGIFIGNPVRQEISEGSKENAISNYNLNQNIPTVLIFGGSSGSTAINACVYPALKYLCEKYNIIHIAGEKGNFSIKYKNYHQIKYAYDINDLFAVSSVVVCRAGSNTLSELASLGKKILTIPLPKGTSRGDQVENALSFQKRGLVKILHQKDMSPETLCENINNLYFSKNNTIKLDIKEINEKIVKKILEI